MGICNDLPRSSEVTIFAIWEVEMYGRYGKHAVATPVRSHDGARHRRMGRLHLEGLLNPGYPAAGGEQAPGDLQ